MQNANCHLSICAWHFEELLALFAEKRPERVAPRARCRTATTPDPPSPASARGPATSDAGGGAARRRRRARRPRQSRSMPGGESRGRRCRRRTASPSDAPDVMSANAPTPSASVDRPDERGQQTPEDEQRRRRRSTCGFVIRYSITRFVIPIANFDADRIGTRGGDAETDARRRRHPGGSVKRTA